MKFFFVDFKALTIEEIFNKIQTLNKQDGVVIRYTNNLNSIKKAIKKAKCCGIENVFCHYKNQMLHKNVHFASSGLNFKAEKTSIAVHSMADLAKIQKTQPNFAFVSPVFYTKTHPNANPLGEIQALKIAFEIKKLSPCTKIILLGGMDGRKFAKIRKITDVILGFAGIRNV